MEVAFLKPCSPQQKCNTLCFSVVIFQTHFAEKLRVTESSAVLSDSHTLAQKQKESKQPYNKTICHKYFLYIRTGKMPPSGQL